MMVFSSAAFLFIFLPIVWIVYSALPSKNIRARNTVLIVAGLSFHAFGEPAGMLLLVFSAIVNYALAVRISYYIKEHNDGKRKATATASVVFNIGVLFIFKYSEWIWSLIKEALPFNLPTLPFTLTLSVGISFYTLQMISYTLDVSRGKTEAEDNLANLILYASFFPKLTSGPIVSYDSIKSRLGERKVTVGDTAKGIRRIIYGLSKKLLIADTVAVVADKAFAASSPSAAFAWAGALCFCLQIYFDFSGYSDMAIGLAQLFGFSLDENFNYPYTAKTLHDFLGRWHITLTHWFYDYVCIPLGGKTTSKLRAVFNLIVVFALAGLWHGAGFTFIVCGLYIALLILLEKAVKPDRIKSNKFLIPVLHIYTLLAVIIGFVMFRSESITSALKYLGNMFSISGNCADILGMINGYRMTVFAVGVILCLPVLPFVRKKLNGKLSAAFDIAEYALSALLFVFCVMTIAAGEFRPFIFYKF